ncbi:glycosyl transferase, family 19 [Stappia aggregata IAM 12614]|uniref:Lipid-A-disaccharide synthase n=1 Tax=Roseibium aggregatum (strain ATCC 25650 / DSM 13394 / JCM 20685 / NBRC 16684 / NCIMB 2208 / IAM 12614 / B1) TaxID=384765 RepID=A0NT50_ROSAI|nr:lipid-A-disaccharide synthase [Roseibium aggregatum]EAV44132.1 glycosyl transferase, family 19 [Stappia aggregata IAM 12614] [Roseibium aggregatum IAM 12614]
MSGKMPTVCLVAGEESGDQLGSELMKALNERLGIGVRYCGVGGERMTSLGLKSFFDMSDVSVMGLTAVLARLPLIIKRVYQTVDAVVAANPDVLVIVDSPDFTHNVAKRVRKRAPHIPIIGYVSPSVWAWRPGRARKMSVYVDELLALLPFEPDVHRKLGGPRTHYVGHPLSENATELRPAAGERSSVDAEEKVLLVLPGSRRSEIDRLLGDFGATVALVEKKLPGLKVVLPAVAHLEDKIRRETAGWSVPVEIVTGLEAKRAAFRKAHAALAASGTVSLELALSGVPMVVAYKVDWFFRRIKDLNRIFKFSSVDSFVLPNIILGTKAIPEFLDEEVQPDVLASHLVELLKNSPERQKQIEHLQRLDDVMRLPDGHSQRGAAADVVLDAMKAGA